jgi:hypothetical protein
MGGHGLLKTRRAEILAALVPWLAGLDPTPPPTAAAMG